MKCPCCGEQTDRPFIIIHNKMYMADGTVRHCTPTPLKLFQQLLTGPIPFPATPYAKQAMFVHLTRLRKFIKEAGLSYTVHSDKYGWFMTVNKS